jgi:hypothetical protein
MEQSSCDPKLTGSFVKLFLNVLNLRKTKTLLAMLGILIACEIKRHSLADILTQTQTYVGLVSSAL